MEDGGIAFTPSQIPQGVKLYEQEQEEGWLLRTKGTDSDKGEVEAGFSVLDSLLPVDVE